MENLNETIKGEFNKSEIPQETIEDLEKELADLEKKEKDTVAGLKQEEPGTRYFSDQSIDYIRERKRKIQEKIDNLKKKRTIQ